MEEGAFECESKSLRLRNLLSFLCLLAWLWGEGGLWCCMLDDSVCGAGSLIRITGSDLSWWLGLFGCESFIATWVIYLCDCLAMFEKLSVMVFSCKKSRFWKRTDAASCLIWIFLMSLSWLRSWYWYFSIFLSSKRDNFYIDSNCLCLFRMALSYFINYFFKLRIDFGSIYVSMFWSSSRAALFDTSLRLNFLTLLQYWFKPVYTLCTAALFLVAFIASLMGEYIRRQSHL